MTIDTVVYTYNKAKRVLLNQDDTKTEMTYVEVSFYNCIFNNIIVKLRNKKNIKLNYIFSDFIVKLMNHF